MKVTVVRNKMLKNTKAAPRRSQRLQNVSSSSRDRDVELVIENIDDSENEEDNPHSDLEKKSPLRIFGEASLEQKIDCLIEHLDQRMTDEASLSQEVERCFSNQNPCLACCRSGMSKDKYKNLYIDSQKKIEELRNENYELSKKLETALGKLEGYEKGQLVLSEALEKFKDAFFISSVTKTADMVSGLTFAGAVKRRLVKSEARGPAIRKKVARGSKNCISPIPSI